MSVYLAHATGFCGSVWRPVAQRIDTPTVAWDFFGHGSAPSLKVPVDWMAFGEQVLDETEPGGIGVGHSMGATALVMAQLADPKRFKALVLVEPIIYPGPHRRTEHPLAASAMKRRRVFGSREEARSKYGSKAFRSWDPAALNGYIDCGLVGEGPVHLACDPDVEADIYRASTEHTTWGRLNEISIPTLILAGAESTLWTVEQIKAQAHRFQHAGFEMVPAAGHFLPMEKPGVVADRTMRLVEASART